MSYSQYQPQRASPGGFALIVTLHAMAIGAVMLIKGPDFVRPVYPSTTTYIVPPEVEPDPNPPETRTDPQPTQQAIAQIIPVIPPPPVERGPITQSGDPPPSFSGTGHDIATVRQADPPPPLPVRREAEMDPRFAAAFRPPYPAPELRAQRDGVVRLRVTIGADGRVRAVERLSATSDAFWAAAERQARNHWRFRPATVDGRPVESVKVLTLHFRIEDA
ncbi:MAG: TonB family protein [Sphingomonas sp.]|nr:TonB family protein [Sphingomonas sp.]